jgi:2-polyprenyl-3-methyl-5-hydroxy-6-metoxy-1,4-benzoquinol methylase
VSDTPVGSPAPAPEAVERDDWDTHWENFAEAAARNPAQSFRRRVVLGLLGTRGEPRRYLDIGSGQGDLAAEVSRRWPGADVAGIELSAKGVDLASAKVPKGRFEQVDLLAGTAPSDGLTGWATHATCSEVLEHVDEPEAFLRSAARWLAPGATLVVTVPGGERSAFDIHIGHRRHYAAAELAALLESAGFTVDECGGAGYPFFNLYRRVVIARGDRLVDDFDKGGDVSAVARIARATFGVLLRISPSRGRRGLQTYALATSPTDRR